MNRKTRKESAERLQCSWATNPEVKISGQEGVQLPIQTKSESEVVHTDCREKE